MARVCSKCRVEPPVGDIRVCPNEAVRKTYGLFICPDCCAKCKHDTGYCRYVDDVNWRELCRVLAKYRDHRTLELADEIFNLICKVGFEPETQHPQDTLTQEAL